MPLDGGYLSRAPRAPALVEPLAQLGNFLIEMWDAERSDLITTATGVSAWAGIKAGLTVTQGTGSAQPIRSATSFGGGAGVAFDGLDDALALTLSGQFPAAGSPSELWVLCQQDAPLGDATVRQALSYGSTAGVTARHLSRVVDASSVDRVRGTTGDGSAQLSNSNRIIGFTGRHMARWQVMESSSLLTIDGMLEGSVAMVPNTTATRLRIGASSATTAATFWQGQIAVALVTQPLPSELAARLTRYLLGRRRV